MLFVHLSVLLSYFIQQSEFVLQFCFSNEFSSFSHKLVYFEFNTDSGNKALEQKSRDKKVHPGVHPVSLVLGLPCLMSFAVSRRPCN